MSEALADEAAYAAAMPGIATLRKTFSVAAMARRIDQVYRRAHGDELPAGAYEEMPA